MTTLFIQGQSWELMRGPRMTSSLKGARSCFSLGIPIESDFVCLGRQWKYLSANFGEEETEQERNEMQGIDICYSCLVSQARADSKAILTKASADQRFDVLQDSSSLTSGAATPLVELTAKGQMSISWTLAVISGTIGN